MREIETFTWQPNRTTTGTSKFATLVAKFGDGYEQGAENGINSESESWPLTFTGSEVRIREIREFLRRHKAIYPFYWTPPLGERALFKSGDLTRTPRGGGVYELTVTFTQGYKP